MLKSQHLLLQVPTKPLGEWVSAPPHFVDEEIELGEAKKLCKHQTPGLQLEFKS